jgi:hypothetical protein
MYCLFLKNLGTLIVTTFDTNLMSVSVLVDGIEGVRHVSCQLEDARLLSDICILSSVSRNVQNRREGCLGKARLSQSW